MSATGVGSNNNIKKLEVGGNHSKWLESVLARREILIPNSFCLLTCIEEFLNNEARKIEKNQNLERFKEEDGSSDEEWKQKKSRKNKKSNKKYYLNN